MAYTHDGDRPSLNHENQLTFQTAVKTYEATIVDMINSRQRMRDTIRLEIDALVKLKVIKNKVLPFSLSILDILT